MKAIAYHRYGSPDMLGMEELPQPVPRDDEVLIKVHAASVNSWDWELLRGTPYANRLMFKGYFKPRLTILGADVAGVVESVGKNVTGFQPGDAVMGDLCESGWGSFAEYVCAHQDAVIPKPEGMSFEDAAAIPQAGAMAMQGLMEQGGILPGQRVLINGAGGGVGTFAVQIAAAMGAEVTGVDRGDKLDMLSALGVDHVIDYTREDFTKNGQTYDVIVDVTLRRSVFDCRRALKPGGRYVVIGGSMTRILQTALLGPFMAKKHGVSMGLLLARPNRELDALLKLIKEGSVRPVIDTGYPLAAVPDAVRHVEQGNARGKVVITV